MHFPIENDDNSGFYKSKNIYIYIPTSPSSHVTTSHDPQGPPSFFFPNSPGKDVFICALASVFEVELDRLRDV